MRRLLIAVIWLYQAGVSPWLGAHCRFTPTCSQYAIEAIQKYGAIRGGAYAVWRVLRCQPFARSGNDPVP